MSSHQSWRERPDDTKLLKRFNARKMPHHNGQPYDLQLPQQLRLVVGERAAVVDVPLRPYMMVGRKDSHLDNDVTVDLAPFDAREKGVSRSHVMMMTMGDCLMIKALRTLNGTLLNGFELEPMQEYLLRHNDELTLGDLIVRVQFVDAR